MTNAERKTAIQELCHQLYYANPGPEREAVRQHLNDWIHYRYNA